MEETTLAALSKYITKSSMQAETYSIDRYLVYTKPGQILKSLIEGKRISPEDKYYVTYRVNTDSLSRTSVLLGGYEFSFRKFLKRFAVITPADRNKADIVYGFDRTSVFKLYKSAIEIIEI